MTNSLTKKLTFFHLLLTIVISILPFFIFYCLWYPEKLIALTGGKEIFKIYLAIELLLFSTAAILLFLSRNDSRKEIFIKYSFLCVLQTIAAIFGYKSLYEAKPMYIAYEFNRFRVVRTIDIQNTSDTFDIFKLISGPIPIGTKELHSSDPEFLISIKDSINGEHPSFKASRHIDYSEAKNDILRNAKNIKNLAPKSYKEIQLLSKKHNIDLSNLIYYPLTSYYSDGWIVLLDNKTAKIITYLNIDGW